MRLTRRGFIGGMFAAIAAPIVARLKSIGDGREIIQLNIAPRTRLHPTSMRTLPPYGVVTEHTMVYRDYDIAHTVGIQTGMPKVPLVGEKVKVHTRG